MNTKTLVPFILMLALVMLVSAVGLASADTPQTGGYSSQTASPASPDTHAAWCQKSGCRSYLANQSCWTCSKVFCSAHISPSNHACKK